MIRTIAFLVVAALAVAGAVWFADRPGAVSIAWGGWQIETSVGVLAVLGVLIAVASALLYSGWRALRRAPRALAAARRQSLRERGYRALTQGMVAVAAGDADEARKQARKADGLLDEPPLTMLLSAQAAQLNGDEAAARRYFTAMLERPETAFLGLRGLLMQAQREGDRPSALRLAQRAYQARPKTPWVLTTLFDLQAKEGRWREALDTLDQAIRRGAVPREDGRRRMAAVLLACAREAEEAGESATALDFAQKARKQAGDWLPAAIREIELQLAAGHRRPAARHIDDAWTRTPHPALARLYAALEDGEDPVKRAQRFEKLAARNPDHPETHIALAEALLAAKLWGAARTHLERAAGAARSARVCRLMAELEEGESGDMAAARSWLLAAASADPDPAWICGACGTQAAAWTPVCPHCGALASIDWRPPLRTPALVAQADEGRALPGEPTGPGAAARAPAPGREAPGQAGPPPAVLER